MNQSRDTPETVEELLERIQPLWDAVDVDNLPDNVVDALTIGAMSGRENDDNTKRLLALRDDGTITRAEYQSIVLKFAYDGEP